LYAISLSLYISVFFTLNELRMNPASLNTLKSFDLVRYEEELQFLVNIDSGSYCLDGLGRIADWFADRLKAIGFEVEFYQAQPNRYGRSLYACFGNPAKLDLLILCHSDTVFPKGTVAAWPFSVSGDRYRGPGVADMKAGCLMALHALEQLRLADHLKGSVGFFLNAEEEISCPTTRSVIEEKSRLASVVISTEPGRADGSCVRQRKGVSRYKLAFHGKTAHSGVAPQDGACAITEMSRLILELKSREVPEQGITINPGLVKGGTSVNTVPDYAECEIDIRVTKSEDATKLHNWLVERVLLPEDPRVRIEIEGGETRPPMVPNSRAEELIEIMNTIGRHHGLDLKWAFSGGGSDACFASAFDIPALCGVGPVGGNYHTSAEYLKTADLNQRLCIFRDFVENICNGKD
jgi:glutamate carboxypeptidase